MSENIIKKVGRPKGSTNKNKNIKLFKTKNNSHSIKIELDKQIPNAPICMRSGHDWVNYGIRNNYPLMLSDLYYNSIVHKACIDFTVQSVIGEGIDYKNMNLNDSELVPNYNESWDTFIYKITLDYVLYGAFSFQIIKNKDDKTYSYYHEPINNVRCGIKDENGDITKYYISSDWTNIAKYPPFELDSFGFQEDNQMIMGKAYLFVHHGYTPDMEYYWSPKYVGAIKAIQTEIELIRYDLRSVLNNFSSSGVLTFSRVEDDEDRQMIIDNVQGMFTGSDNANSLMIAFAENGEDEPVKFTKIDKDINNVNIFESSNERNIDRIVAAHRIPSKQLIGITTDGAQLGGTGNELNVAYNLFNKTVVNNLRIDIVNTINRMLALNNVETKIILKPLTFNVMEPTEIKDNIDEIDETKNESVANDENISDRETNNNMFK